MIVFAILAGAAAADAAASLTVVIVLADDAGWGDFSFVGNRAVATPVIDGLARHGAILRKFCVQPVCSPTAPNCSRAATIRGRA